ITIAIIFLKNQTRPIVNLAKAAEKFGRGEKVDEYRPSGAMEIRQAGLEFDKMRKRIMRHLNQRSEMLSGISHDLRTPLTRLKLHVAIATWEWGSYFDPKLKINGIRLNISNWRRPAPNTIPWDTKASGLYMICTLSKHEAEQQGYTDSLMLDHAGNVAEATGANIFFKDKNNELHTPIPDSFLDGITRRTVIDIAKSKGIKIHERKIKPEELKDFVGCFLTGTAAEVTPVSCIADNEFKVCETIIDLNESYQALVRSN
ncbi:aminotransferase class IV, partial [Candidatus Pelagibacter sp.]|nr:aminotransferase class IV [Candidatus Pelagibacter sp.]